MNQGFQLVNLNTWFKMTLDFSTDLIFKRKNQNKIQKKVTVIPMIVTTDDSIWFIFMVRNDTLWILRGNVNSMTFYQIWWWIWCRYDLIFFKNDSSFHDIHYPYDKYDDKYILFQLLRIVLQYFDRITTDLKSSMISFVSVKFFDNWNWHDFKIFSADESIVKQFHDRRAQIQQIYFQKLKRIQ